jgi:tetratricopeptide (TPR) repeat protein
MDESEYSVHNEGTLQGQVVGDRPTVHQYFYGTRADVQRPSTPERIWNVPYRHNPFFTGRESVLEEVHRRLTTTKATALTQPQALSGLGGIGKTQIAVEYAYRHRDEYHDVVWVNAGTRETIITSFLELAETLQLPEKQEQDQSKVVTAMQRWFIEHDHWLLIFDNADDLTLAEEYLPASANGHLLLTTRQQSPGTLADSIDIDTMDKHEGTLLILRRTKLLAADAPLAHAKPEDRTQAERIVAVMDGLPLALDQAAAYIEETRCSFTAFLEAYQDVRTDLLRRRGRTGKNHPLPVATTWKLSFERVQQANPSAADLLDVCAFLAPDAIPEDMLIAGASELGPHLAVLKDHPLQWNEAIAKLLDFSLIRRTREKQSLAIHRLVQEVLRMEMDEPTRKTWAERCVRAMNEAFPQVDFTTWSQCERYLVHTLQGVELIHEYALNVQEAARLLHQTASYLYDRAQYTQAEPLYQQALSIYQKTLPPEHPHTATTMHELARLYQAQGRYAEAEPLYQQALSIYQKALPPEHSWTAITMHELASLYQAQGRYAEAEPLYQQALSIYQKTLPPEHPDTAATMHALASLYQAQGRYAEAEPLYQQALSIKQKTLPPEHPNTATTMHALASLYQAQGRYAEAEPLYQQALSIYQKTLLPEHPWTATTMHQLAALYQAQGRYAEAKPLYQHALLIFEKTLGSDHPSTRIARTNYEQFLAEAKKRKLSE